MHQPLLPLTARTTNEHAMLIAEQYGIKIVQATSSNIEK
jgi:hypothetical protein